MHCQAANVHAILESGPAVAGVAERLHHATSLLDDFEQNLTIFDIKLRHMREDIAAIEARNNSLELQARNNTKLLSKLESAYVSLQFACYCLVARVGRAIERQVKLVHAGLLQLLELPGQSERLLAGAGIAMSTLPNVVQAAWQLHDSVEALKVVQTFLLTT